MGGSTSIRRWIWVALGWFFIAALLGSMLRYAFVWELPEFISYKYIQHTHSHIAMLGWIYSAIFIMIVLTFDLTQERYSSLFWWTQVTVAGMFISFPLQGYGLFSIVFSSVHILLSYLFAAWVIKDLRNRQGEANASIKWVVTALAFMVLSTLGTWALGLIMNSPLKGSAWYYGAIQFFLHFQFNGWMIFGLLAVLMRMLDHWQISINRNQKNRFYQLLVISCPLTFALAVTWSTPDTWIFWLNAIGLMLQFAALWFFVTIIWKVKMAVINRIRTETYYLWILAALTLFLKILIQTLVAIPYLATISYTIRNFVVGFIHLLMLGTISSFMLGFIFTFGGHGFRSGIKGIWIFLAGFFTSEILLFLQGVMLWQEWGFLPNYHLMLFVASSLMPVGLLYYMAGNQSVLKMQTTSHRNSE